MAAPRLTRRAALATWATGAATLSTTGRALAAKPKPHAPFVHGTTLDTTVLRGTVVNPQGYRHLAAGAGEPWLVRDDLGVKPHAGRAKRRVAVASFVQFTDTHIVDAQSPGRVEWTDRYNDGAGSSLIFASAYRPHEMFSAHVTDSLMRQVRRLGKGPATGRRFDFTICTGDVVDNCQHNELRWAIDLLDGERVTPDSGDLTKWEGVADLGTYDIHYWHPDGAPDGQPVDNAHGLYGFPIIKGLLDLARRPFKAAGVGMPWFTAYGNHDGLSQGNFPKTFPLGALNTGSQKVISAPAGLTPDDVAHPTQATIAAVLAAPMRQVTPDPDRRMVSRAETIAEYFKTTGTPVGHGFTATNQGNGTAYYTFKVAKRVLGVVLDTVNPNGEADGSIDPAQLTWLQTQLQRAKAKRQLVVVFSHHTSQTMTNALTGTDNTDPRVLGDAVVAALLAVPNVILWVNGHTHVNAIEAHARPGGGGFWEVQTAAHIDFPAQARLVELADNRDGTLSVFGTIIDAAAPLRPSYKLSGLTTSAKLASLARELAVNDWQERPMSATASRAALTPDGRRGTVADRNVELVVKAPFKL